MANARSKADLFLDSFLAQMDAATRAALRAGDRDRWRRFVELVDAMFGPGSGNAMARALADRLAADPECLALADRMMAIARGQS